MTEDTQTCVWRKTATEAYALFAPLTWAGVDRDLAFGTALSWSFGKGAVVPRAARHQARPRQRGSALPYRRGYPLLRQRQIGIPRHAARRAPCSLHLAVTATPVERDPFSRQPFKQRTPHSHARCNFSAAEFARALNASLRLSLPLRAVASLEVSHHLRRIHSHRIHTHALAVPASQTTYGSQAGAASRASCVLHRSVVRRPVPRPGLQSSAARARRLRHSHLVIRRTGKLLRTTLTRFPAHRLALPTIAHADAQFSQIAFPLYICLLSGRADNAAHLSGKLSDRRHTDAPLPNSRPAPLPHDLPNPRRDRRLHFLHFIHALRAFRIHRSIRSVPHTRRARVVPPGWALCPIGGRRVASPHNPSPHAGRRHPQHRVLVVCPAVLPLAVLPPLHNSPPADSSHKRQERAPIPRRYITRPVKLVLHACVYEKLYAQLGPQPQTCVHENVPLVNNTHHQAGAGLPNAAVEAPVQASTVSLSGDNYAYIPSIRVSYFCTTTFLFTFIVGVSSPPSTVKSVGSSVNFRTLAALLMACLLARLRPSLM